MPGNIILPDSRNNGLITFRVDELAQRIALLTAGFLQQSLSKAEHDELNEWIAAGDDNRLLFEEITNPEYIEKALLKWNKTDHKSAFEKIKEKLSFSKTKQPLNLPGPKKVTILIRNFLPNCIMTGK